VGVALRTDIETLRAALKAFHMLEPPNAWIAKPRHIGPILTNWAKGRRVNARHYPPKLGPDRNEMFQAIGVTETA
jgi:hypothetical protein